MTFEQATKAFNEIERREYGDPVTPSTRGEANEKVDRQKRYSQILEILNGNEMTAKEIAVAMYVKGLIPTAERNYSAPRLTEMSQMGMVEPIGKKKCQYTGKTVAVYAERTENVGATGLD